MSESRSEFEAWYVETYQNGWGVARFNGSGRYCHDHPSNQWICWQASRRAALEEAARVCDGLAADHDEDAVLEVDERYAIYAKHQRNCASAIRAIARKEN
jgi:hypothetical protein